MSIDYNEWRSVAAIDYEVVIHKMDSVVYEVILDGERVGHTLREVLDMCEGTMLEEPIRRAVMKAVYTNCSLEAEVKKVMDIYYI